MLRTSVLLFTVALGLLVGLAVHFADDRPVLYTYTGSAYCKGCHASTAAGEIFQVWDRSAHASAYSVLESPQAREYLAQNNVRMENCLQCHTTLGRPALSRKEHEINLEGVGCERCHGPGSAYSQTVVMKDREAFVRTGGSPGTLDNCYSCHARNPAEDSIHCPLQTEEFDAEKIWPEIMHPVRSSRSWSDSVGSGPESDSTKPEEAQAE